MGYFESDAYEADLRKQGYGFYESQLKAADDRAAARQKCKPKKKKAKKKAKKNTKPLNDGWQCPQCKRVWGPHVDECRACNGGDDGKLADV